MHLQSWPERAADYCAYKIFYNSELYCTVERARDRCDPSDSPSFYSRHWLGIFRSCFLNPKNKKIPHDFDIFKIGVADFAGRKQILNSYGYRLFVYRSEITFKIFICRCQLPCDGKKYAYYLKRYNRVRFSQTRTSMMPVQMKQIFFDVLYVNEIIRNSLMA